MYMTLYDYRTLSLSIWEGFVDLGRVYRILHIPLSVSYSLDKYRCIPCFFRIDSAGGLLFTFPPRKKKQGDDKKLSR